MKKVYIGSIIALFVSVFIIGGSVAEASVRPISGMSISIRQNVDGATAIAATTTADGSFSVTGLANGTYNVYVNGGTTPISQAKAVNGVIKGRVMIAILGPEEQPTFEKDKWDTDRLQKLKDILMKEGVLPAFLENSDLKIGSLDLRNIIKHFQEKFGIPNTGNIGPITTKKLNDLHDEMEVENEQDGQDTHAEDSHTTVVSSSTDSGVVSSNDGHGDGRGDDNDTEDNSGHN